MKMLYKFSGLFFKIHRFFFERARAQELKHALPSEVNKIKWYNDQVEYELRYNYDLNENSVVIDVGGYKGEFASYLFARYQCKLFVFEPVKKYYTLLQNTFKNNQNIKIFPYGLGHKKEDIQITVMEEASSYNRTASKHKTGDLEKIQIEDIKTFIQQHNISKIDLIKINIEGAEYDLLDRMIKLDILKNCKNLQIQFHDFYPDYEKRYAKITTELSRSHKLTYRYPFVWENWQMK